jgi:hypothetical protein
MALEHAVIGTFEALWVIFELVGGGGRSVAPIELFFGAALVVIGEMVFDQNFL